MAEKTADRIPADQLLLNFLKEHDIVLIVDKAAIVTNTVKDLVWTVDERPRVRVQYKSELRKQSDKKNNGGNGGEVPVEPNIEVSH